MRDRKEQTLTLSLPDRKDSSELLDIEDDEDGWADAESYYDITEMQKEMANVRPDMEIAVQEASKAAQEVRESLCRAQREYKHQSERQRKPAQEAAGRVDETTGTDAARYGEFTLDL